MSREVMGAVKGVCAFKLVRRLTALMVVFLLMWNVSCLAEIGRLKHLDVDGADYIEKPDITTLLILGTDRKLEQGASARRYQRSGQADFLLLVVIDHADKQIHQLQLERDTMTEITTIGVLGNITGTRVTQLCLQYGMGDGYEMSCDLTADAVSKLLLDTEIDLYLSLPLAGISVINDTLGGVTVTLPADYTVYDPEMTEGAVLTLTGKQAEYMVRGRMEIGDGTNASRMQRQQVYMRAATRQFKDRLKEDVNFADTMLDALDEIMVCNFTRGRIINELNRAYKYDILPAETLAGEYTIGEDGFREFHVDEDALKTWVVETFYAPNN